MDSSEPTIPVLDLSQEIEDLWDELRAATERVMRSGRFVLGPEVEAFEGEVADYLGVGHAVGLNSGTDALVIALRALGIGPGDEVITTPFSFFATAEAISQVGATPVFVDIEEDTLNLDPAGLEPALTAKTKAVLPVHLFGLPAAMTRITAFAEAHGLKVIEDCAQSFGAAYFGTREDESDTSDETRRAKLEGRMTGGVGDVGTFSFYPTKNLGAMGDAGMLVTHDPEVAKKARALRNHGSERRYYNESLGYNSRLDELQAAVLRVKLPHVARWNLERRQVAERYQALFADTPDIKTPPQTPGHIFHQYTVRVPAEKRDHIREALEQRGIGSSLFYPVPINRLPMYAHLNSETPVSDQVAREVLSLPMYPSLTCEEQRRVTGAVEAGIRAHN